jgi:chromosomal replication initiation ATPase DnaA
MNEEVYASLLAQSAKQTSLAMALKNRSIKIIPLSDPIVHAFYQVRDINNHDIEVLIREFAKLSNTTINVLIGRDRTMHIANTRNVMFYVLHRYIGLSNPQIARIFCRFPRSILTGRKRGEEIVNKNQFLVDLISRAVCKSKKQEE